MKSIFTWLLVLNFHPIFAQQSGGELCSKHKIQALSKARIISKTALPGDEKIDVGFHKISLDIDYDKKYIKGNVTTRFKAKSDITECFFDLVMAHKVDSITIDSKKVIFKHLADKITITLPQKLLTNQLQDVRIFYQGKPPTGGFGSFSFGTHGADKSPVVWSLSEPYGAADWWPCKNDLTDKVDSSEVSVTMSPFFYSVSNGILINTQTNSITNTKTYTWKNSYPIAHYLISIACSNYTLYNLKFQYGNKTMPFDNFLYPEVVSDNLKSKINTTLDMLKFFSDVFGEYPFIKEKYGHAMCQFGGGMEHQTVSSMGGFDEFLIAHELAHQWFGDNITCQTWSDIFVNEAFASYSEALFNEYKYGKETYNQTINAHIIAAKKVTQKIYIEKPENVNAIFEYNLTYRKGAVVLHMLRGVIGDEAFFTTLKTYQSSNLKLGTATIDDFRKIAEKVSNKDLKYFFDEWIYGVSYPKFTMGWIKNTSKGVDLKIQQTELTTTPKFFTSPVQLKIVFEEGKDSLTTVFVNKLSNDFKLDNLKGIVKSIVFDPNNYIMKEYSAVNLLVTSTDPESSKSIVYPNPSDGNFEVDSKDSKVMKIEIYNLSGNLIKSAKLQTKIEANDLHAGKYILKIYYQNNHVETKNILVK